MNAGRLTAIETGATALWVGASAGFAFIFAPTAFRLVTDRDLFAQLTERSLGRLATLTYVAGGLAAGCALFRSLAEPASRVNITLRLIAGGGALLAIGYHQRAIVPSMTSLQTAMGRFADVADDDPQRIAYRAMHRRSTRVYGTALLFGIAQLMLAATSTTADEPSA